MGNRIEPATSTSPASTALTTTNTCPAFCGRSSNAPTPKEFTDNSWAGLERDSICYCDNCERKFRAKTGQPIPRRANWDDPVYRQWILWNYARRTEIWELNNRDHPGRRRSRLHLVRHEQWLDLNAGGVLPRLQRDLQPRPHRHAGPPARAATPPAFSRMAIPASASTGCLAGTSWRRRAWPCTRPAARPSVSRASRRPRRACGCLTASRAASSPGGTTSARTTKTGGCIARRSRS